MRTRVSFAFTGILLIALIAVVGFAAFSAQGDGSATTQAADEPDADPFLPRSASGRILGAVVAAALTPEPEIETAEAAPATEPSDSQRAEVASSATTEPATTSSTTTTSTTTTTEAPQPSTANITPPDTTAPDISVATPKDGATVDDRVIEFTGTTEEGASVTSGSYEADVDEDGNWSIKLVLREGRNRAYFTATDEAGNSETTSITVTYDPPETTTTSTSTTTTTTTTTTEPPPDTGGPRDVEEWRSLVEDYFPAELVEEALSVMRCESKGDPAAYNSRSGASGLFQFIPSTWNWASSNAGWAGASPFDPEANVASAAWLVQWSLDRGKDAWTHWSCKP